MTMKTLCLLLLALTLTASAATTNQAPATLPLLDPTGLPVRTAILPAFDLLSVVRINAPLRPGIQPNAFSSFAWISLPASGSYPIASNWITCTNGKSHPFTQVGNVLFSSSNLCNSGDCLYVYYCSNGSNPPTNMVPELNVYYAGNTYSFAPAHWWAGEPTMQWCTAPIFWGVSNNVPWGRFDLGTVGFSCTPPPPQ